MFFYTTTITGHLISCRFSEEKELLSHRMRQNFTSSFGRKLNLATAHVGENFDLLLIRLNEIDISAFCLQNITEETLILYVYHGQFIQVRFTMFFKKKA